MDINVEVLSNIVGWIQLVLMRAQNLSSITSKIAKDMRAEIMMNFVLEGRPHWKKLSDVWLAYKAKHGYSTRILDMTGVLRNSFGMENDNKRAVVYSDVTYAPYHEYGAPRSHLPQREFLQFPKGKETTYQQWVDNYIFNGE